MRRIGVSEQENNHDIVSPLHLRVIVFIVALIFWISADDHATAMILLCMIILNEQKQRRT